MELRRYVVILRRRGWVILLAVVAAVSVTLLRVDTTVTYTARSTVYVGASSFLGDTEGSGRLSGDLNAGLAQLIRTYATMIDSDTVAQEVITRTGIRRGTAGLVAGTVAGPILGTNILAIDVRDTDPAVAQAAATGFAEVFVERIAELESADAGEGVVPTAPANIFERARLPSIPESTSVVSSAMLAALLAFAAASALVLFGEYLDVTVKSSDDAEHRLDLPVLAAVPVLRSIDRRPPRRQTKPAGADAFELIHGGARLDG